MLHGHLPHEFQVAVLGAWAGWPASPPASTTIESYRALFFSELLRLVPHDDDVVNRPWSAERETTST